jgi:hypothetical protein
MPSILKLETPLKLARAMLRSIDTELVVVHGGVDEIRGELPTIRETARGITELLEQVALLKGTTISLQTELGSILEKVAELAALDRRSSGPAASSYEAEEDSIRSAKIQTILPALREALSRLTVSFQMYFVSSSTLTRFQDQRS